MANPPSIQTLPNGATEIDLPDLKVTPLWPAVASLSLAITIAVILGWLATGPLQTTIDDIEKMKEQLAVKQQQIDSLRAQVGALSVVVENLCGFNGHPSVEGC